jgi:hypothetical protein
MGKSSSATESGEGGDSDKSVESRRFSLDTQHPHREARRPVSEREARRSIQAGRLPSTVGLEASERCDAAAARQPGESNPVCGRVAYRWLSECI